MTRNKNVASDHAWRAIAHAIPRALQKAQFIKGVLNPNVQPFSFGLKKKKFF